MANTTKRNNIRVIDIDTESGTSHLITVNNVIYVLSEHADDQIIKDQINTLSNEILNDSETVNVLKYNFKEQDMVYKDNIDKILQHEVDILTNEIDIECDIDKLKDTYFDCLDLFEDTDIFTEIDDNDFGINFLNCFEENVPKLDII